MTRAVLPDAVATFFERELALATGGLDSVFIPAFLAVLALSFVIVIWFTQTVGYDDQEDTTPTVVVAKRCGGCNLPYVMPALSCGMPALSASTESTLSTCAVRRARPAHPAHSECGGLYGEEQPAASRARPHKHSVQVEIPCEPGHSSPTVSQPDRRRDSHAEEHFGRSPSAPLRLRPMWGSRAAETKSMTEKSMSDSYNRSWSWKTGNIGRAPSSNTPSRHGAVKSRPRASPPQVAPAKQVGPVIRKSSSTSHFSTPQVAHAKQVGAAISKSSPNLNSHLSSSAKYYAEVVKRQHVMSRTGMLGATLCKNLPTNLEQIPKSGTSSSGSISSVLKQNAVPKAGFSKSTTSFKVV